MKKIIAAFLFLLSFVLNAQAPKKFYTRFGGYGHDIGYSVVQTLNGQYAVTGSTSSFGNGNTDVYLALVDSMGWVRWEKSYGGFNNDIGRSIIQLKDSGFVIAGYTNSFGSGGYDVFAVRTDKNGNLIWQKAFGGFDWDFGYYVKESNGGDSLIICGNTYSFGYGKSDGYIIKTDINGNLQWQKAYGGAEDDEFKSFTLTYNNQYAFAGTTKSMGDTKGDCWLMKTNLGGDSILGVKYGDNKIQFLNGIEEDPNNNRFILTGATDFDGRDSTQAYILIMDDNFNYMFNNQFSYHNMTDAQFYSSAYLKNDTYVYMRKQFNSSFGRKLEPMIMINAPIWDIPGGVTTYGSTEEDDLFQVKKTRDKGFVCIGYTKGFSANLTDVFLVKIDSNYNSIANGPSLVSVQESNPVIKSLNVFPTLTQDYIYVTSENVNKKLKLDIINNLGEQIESYDLESTNNPLNISHLNEGVYFIRISFENETETFKVIKLN